MSEKARPSYLLKAGENWLMIPPRIAALIESRTNIGALRVQLRGLDPEASAVLQDLRQAAMSWPGCQTETTDDEIRQPATRSKWMSCSEVAVSLGISRQAVGKAIRDRRLPASRVGDRWQINREDMEHYRATRAA